MGGTLGLFIRFCSEFIPPYMHFLLYAVTAGIVGWTGIWASERLPQSTAAQLFVITFILVFAEGSSMVRPPCHLACCPPLCFHVCTSLVNLSCTGMTGLNGHDSSQSRCGYSRQRCSRVLNVLDRGMQQDANAIYVSRTVGIIAGVFLSLLFTITILPSSAHNEVDTQLSSALHGLLRLHGLVWLPLKDTPVLTPPRAATEAAAGMSGVKAQLPGVAL
jgi:hypothetical protein